MGDNGERVPRCPVCDQPVRDQKTAIVAPGGGGAPAHFDCALQELARREPLQPGEKITYLGKGTFGVVLYRSAPGGAPYVIRKRIPWEPPPRGERPTQSPPQ